MIRRRFAAAVLFAISAAAPAAAGAPSMPCAQVASIVYPDVRITAAVAVPAATTGAIRAPHCRVDGVIGTETRFTLLLPDAWNQKFFMGGGGGFVGSVQNSAAFTVNQGFATVGTDTGHAGGGTDASWALNNIERRVNFGYLAVHRTADVAKAIIARYYGSDASTNYFLGCSRGGGQGVMEALRYPGDFDGIVAGAPAMDWTGIGAEFIKDAQAAFPDGKTPLFTPDVMKAVGARILEACDAADGVKDGVMEDPRACTVNVDALPASDAQRAALKKIYAPTIGPEGQLYPGQVFGGEAETAGWPAWISGGAGPQSGSASLRYAFGTNIFKYIVFNDPAWDYTKYTFANFKKDTELTASYLNSNNPDLAAFKASGHKLILWHGWADAGLSPLGTVDYYEQLQKRDAAARDYARLFMLPGVLHCGGGAGPDSVDWVAAIADWVEHGKAPDRLIAKKAGRAGEAGQSRPLCPYPQHASYTGSGSADDETNFVCR